MAEVTVRGRISNTDLDVGQEVRVERTARVDAMIDAGHIDLIEVHEEPKEVKRRGKSRAATPEPEEAPELPVWGSLSGSGQIHQTDDGGSEEASAG